MYCARGDMENRIKDQQLDLFADRASCHRFWPNQFRQLLSGLAYTLIEGLRRLALKNTNAGRRQSESYPLNLVEDRRGGAAQYPPHPTAAFQRLSAPGIISYRCLASGLFLTPSECCPGTMTNNGGGEVRPKSVKRCLNNRSGPKYRRRRPCVYPEL